MKDLILHIACSLFESELRHAPRNCDRAMLMNRAIDEAFSLASHVDDRVDDLIQRAQEAEARAEEAETRADAEARAATEARAAARGAEDGGISGNTISVGGNSGIQSGS